MVGDFDLAWFFAEAQKRSVGWRAAGVIIWMTEGVAVDTEGMCLPPVILSHATFGQAKRSGGAGLLGQDVSCEVWSRWRALGAAVRSQAAWGGVWARMALAMLVFGYFGPQITFAAVSRGR